MATFAEGVKNALRAYPCFALRNGEYAYGFASRIFPLTPAGAIADGIGGLRRLLGCEPTEDPPQPDAPFTGGQCPVQYRIDYSFIREDGLSFSETFQPFNGPIVAEVWGAPGPGDGNSAANCASQGLQFRRWQIRSGSTPQQGLGLIAGCTPANLTSFTVTRLDGQPDNCGSPPIIYPPPTNIDIDIDVTYNIEDGPDITVTVPFTFAPVNVDLSGNFSAPFTFNFGGLDFSGTVEIAPNFNVNINPPTAPRGTGDGIDELPDGDPTEEVEPVSPSEKVIGVAVTSVLVGEQKLTTIATQNIPTIFAPRAGSIKFAYSLGVSTFWSDDIDIKGDRTFIPCPFSQGADFVAVSPAPGVEVQWRAITGYPLATVADVS